MIKIPPTDTDFKIQTIKEVTKYKWKPNSYNVTWDDGISLTVRSPKFKLKAGMKAKVYGESSWGGIVRGIEIVDGPVIYYKTAAESIAEQERRRLKMVRKMDEEKAMDYNKFVKKMSTASHKIETVDISGFGRG